MRYVSLVAAFCIWLLFLYTAFVALVIHFLPYFVADPFGSSEPNHRLVWFLMADLAIMQALAWAYKKLPARPQSRLFAWLERVSIF